MSSGFRFFATKAHGLNLTILHAVDFECASNSLCTFLAQSQVVFTTTAFVCITFNFDFQLAIR